MLMIWFKSIIFFLFLIQIAYTAGDPPIASLDLYTCNRRLPACQNDDNALFCYLDRLFTAYLTESKCLGYFHLGFCNHGGAELLILQENCPKTYKEFCNTRVYIAGSSNTTRKSNDTISINTDPDNHLKMYQKTKEYFATNTCEKVLSLFGCGSTSKAVTATTIATFCPNLWIKTCEHVAIDDSTLPLDQTKNFLLDLTLDCKKVDHAINPDLSSINYELTQVKAKAQALKSEAENLEHEAHQFKTSIEASISAEELQRKSEAYRNVTEAQLNTLIVEGNKYLENAKKMKQEALALKENAQVLVSKSEEQKFDALTLLRESEDLKKVVSDYEKKSQILQQNALNYSRQTEYLKTNITDYLNILDMVKNQTEQNKDAANLLKDQTLASKIEFEELYNKTLTINTTVSSIQEEIENVNSTYTAIQVAIQYMNSSFSFLLNETQLLNQSSIAIRQDMQTVNASAVTMQQDIQSLNASGYAAQQLLESLNQENEENKNKIIELKIEITNLTRMLKDFESDIQNIHHLKTENMLALKAVEDTQAIIAQITIEYNNSLKAMDDLNKKTEKCCPLVRPARPPPMPVPEVVTPPSTAPPPSVENVVSNGSIEQVFEIESSNIVPLDKDTAAENSDRSNEKLNVIMLGLLWIALQELF